MGFSTLLLLIFIILIGIYSYLLLALNKSVVHLDLLFLELDFHLGNAILISFLIGMFITIILEIIFFSSKRKNEK
tara:strand:+ start:179 stop:403 length:225 start_codon:yes stop_codon:yes gene_type:complete